MTANDLLAALTQALFVLVFLVVIVQAARRPRRVTIDTALLFGVVALLVAEGSVASVLHVKLGPLLAAASSSLLMALPYLLLRLADDFAGVPRWIIRLAESGLAAAVVSLFVAGSHVPPWLALLYVGYFVGLTVYAGVAFVRVAQHSRGVTRRRMQAVATGTFFLGLAILIAGLQVALPALRAWWTVLANLSALGSGLGYVVGFVPPSWLRRAWQAPEVRAFFGGLAQLPYLPETTSVIQEMERGAAAAVGAPHAAIGVWDEAAQTLSFPSAGDRAVPPLDRALTERVFVTQQAVLAAHGQPDRAPDAHAAGMMAALVAPITTGPRRLGVLGAYGPRAPLFADDDLSLLEVLASQAAVVLASRALIDDLAQRSVDLTTANKELEAFSYSVSHDLRAPLRAINGFSGILLKEYGPQLPPEAHRYLDLVRANAQQMGQLVDDLLAFSRLGRQPLTKQCVAPGPIAQAILTELRAALDGRRVEVTVEELPACQADPALLAQVFANLLGNALKFTAQREVACITVGCCTRDHEQVYFVRDNGVGFDMQYAHKLFGVFQRLHRAEEYEGTGVGLATVQRIIHRHGGRIWADAALDHGATFWFTLEGGHAA